jgi:tetratricopeptide (TPR) repeat protein
MLGKSTFYALALAILSLIATPALIAKPVAPPPDPSQSITYWKSQVIDAQHDNEVALAQSVFSVLLRSWDSARVEPNLYVVKSQTGPWAASLADGNILLSRSAIDVCLEYGKQSARDLLAFILGHELAHQRAEDLWHQKFLRLAGSQAPEIQQKLLKDLNINPDTISQLESREAQADHDGLLIMASVGYDPFRIVEQKDFFTTWVENLWNVSCTRQTSDNSIKAACNKARTRALRTRTQLATVAAQNTLFDLGIQSFVAARYDKAREYFNAFGKEFPSPAVFANIGLTYLQPAIDIEHKIATLSSQSAGGRQPVKFHYPVMLSETALHHDTALMAATNKRGAIDVLIGELTDRKHQLIESAIEQFEKAIRLQPDHRDGYILLAAGYLVDDNTFMTRGILQGKYIPKFSDDPAARLLLAITNYKENHVSKAIDQFKRALQKASHKKTGVAGKNALTFTAAQNLTAVLAARNQHQQARRVWQSVAKRANREGNSYLFQLAVSRVNPDMPTNINSRRQAIVPALLGQSYAINSASRTVSELWLDGEKLYVVRPGQGRSLVVNEQNRVISASNVSLTRQASQKLTIGENADRPLKQFGVPARRVQLHSGEYLAYDNLSLAVHIIDNRVAGWFLYQPADH